VLLQSSQLLMVLVRRKTLISSQRENFHSYLLMCISPLSPGVLSLDPWLEPYKDALKSRFSYAQSWVKKINEAEGGLEKFSRVCSFRRPGLTYTPICSLSLALSLSPTFYDISCWLTLAAMPEPRDTTNSDWWHTKMEILRTENGLPTR
jgi:hypothetical protein